MILTLLEETGILMPLITLSGVTIYPPGHKDRKNKNFAIVTLCHGGYAMTIRINNL